MATLFESKRAYYLKEKGIDGKWRSKYLGKIWDGKKGLRKREAEEIRKEADSRELYNKHRQVIREINLPPDLALDEFLKNELLKNANVYRLAENTKKSYDTQVEYLKKWFEKIAVKKMMNLNIDQVKSFQFDCNELAQKTLKLRQQLLFRFLKWCHKKGYWNRADELDTIKKVKKVKTKVRFLSPENLSKLFEIMPEKYKNATKFQYYVGARAGEIGQLKWSNYHEEIGSLTFPVYEGMKKKQEVTVFISSKAKEVLKQQKKITGDNMYIFSNTRGEKLSYRNLAEAEKRAFQKLNIDETSHVLRHTFASHLAIAGVSILIIKELMRHEDINDTMIYAHLMNTSQKEAVELLPV